jgi:MarR family transcriptional regulator, organic hydroperoxide resistance regulator
VAAVEFRSGPNGEAVCIPDNCPCENGACTLSKYVRTTNETAADDHHTLAETEKAVADLLTGMRVDMESMAAVQNIYRAANAVRKRLESSVLAPHDLTWTGWVVLWVVWIWGDIETRHVATEAGISKGTLTGVVGTLEKRGLLKRRTHPDDARRVLVSLTPKGRRLMVVLFPKFNAEESFVTESLSATEKAQLATSLRKVALQVEPD